MHFVRANWPVFYWEFLILSYYSKSGRNHHEHLCYTSCVNTFIHLLQTQHKRKQKHSYRFIAFWFFVICQPERTFLNFAMTFMNLIIYIYAIFAVILSHVFSKHMNHEHAITKVVIHVIILTDSKCDEIFSNTICTII